MKKKKILVITPTMGRTGSEIVLFNLLNNSVNLFGFSLLSIKKGTLFNSIDPSIKKSYLQLNHPDSLFFKIYKRIVFSFILPVKLFVNRKNTWYINTIMPAYILKYAKKFNARCMVHTHELAHMLNLLNPEDKDLLFSIPYLVIANSSQSAGVFEQNGFKGALEVCYPFIDSKKYFFMKQKYDITRRSLSLSNDDFVWLMCGTIDENKNPELFIQLADFFATSNLHVKFIWVGDNTNDQAYKNRCIEKSRHLHSLKWIHETDEKYMDYMNCCDGFLLTSHFESFSLVTLEALALGKPVVANDCLGVSEIIDSPAIGTIVAKGAGLEEFINEMTSVMNGETAFEKQKAIDRSRDFDIQVALARWHFILNKHL